MGVAARPKDEDTASLYGMARRVLPRTPAWAVHDPMIDHDDLVQEAVVKAWRMRRGLPEGIDESTARAWTYRALRHGILSACKIVGRTSETRLRPVRIDGIEALDQTGVTVSFRANPEQVVIAREGAREWAEFVSRRLTETERRVVLRCLRVQATGEGARLTKAEDNALQRVRKKAYRVVVRRRVPRRGVVRQRVLAALKRLTEAQPGGAGVRAQELTGLAGRNTHAVQVCLAGLVASGLVEVASVRDGQHGARYRLTEHR